MLNEGMTDQDSNQDKNSVENYFMYWEMKLIERTVPDKPSSKNQKYKKR